MPTVSIPAPLRLYVQWSCRRCGHTGGVARTTVPLPLESMKEPVLRELFLSLRRKLVRKHAEKQGCIATVDDFKIERATQEQAKIAGLV